MNVWWLIHFAWLPVVIFHDLLILLDKSICFLVDLLFYMGFFWPVTPTVSLRPVIDFVESHTQMSAKWSQSMFTSVSCLSLFDLGLELPDNCHLNWSHHLNLCHRHSHHPLNLCQYQSDLHLVSPSNCQPHQVFHLCLGHFHCLIHHQQWCCWDPLNLH